MTIFLTVERCFLNDNGERRREERQFGHALFINHNRWAQRGEKVFETCNMIELRLTSEGFGRYHTLHFAEA